MRKNDKQLFDFIKNNNIPQRQNEEQRIEFLVNRLINVLYSPVEQNSENEVMFHADYDKIKKLGINGSEPINWGDLGCVVEKKDPYYLVTIEEAAPDLCLTLCQYIEKHLKSWGWDVVVQTEW